jgi:hypothetical protein
LFGSGSAHARDHVRVHRHIHPRVYRAPVVAKPPARRVGPWDASYASFVLSAESLFGIGYARQSLEAKVGAEQQTEVTSGASIHFLKGSEFVDPFGAARMGFDGVVGPGFTFGGSIGYSTVDFTARRNNGSSESLRLTELVLVPRIGFMLAPSRYVGVWLRAGVGYANLGLESRDGPTFWGVDAIFDPMLVFTPIPHVGLLLGPSLNVGVAGSEDAPKAPPGTTVRNTWSSYGVSGGIALLF